MWEILKFFVLVRTIIGIRLHRYELQRDLGALVHLKRANKKLGKLTTIYTWKLDINLADCASFIQVIGESNSEALSTWLVLRNDASPLEAIERFNTSVDRILVRIPCFYILTPYHNDFACYLALSKCPRAINFQLKHFCDDIQIWLYMV